jgi:purine-nucleoside phosphorylase
MIPIETSFAVVVIQDHLALPNMTGMNPLLGPPVDRDYPRFLPLSNAYSTSLRRLAFIAAHKLGLPEDALEEGVYAWVSGPTYETAAEGR